VTATTTTTIRGVSLLTPQRRRGGDAFDLALSLDGIEIRRPGQAVQRMSWSRVSQWEIEERRDYCLLTLRGDGATTPLVVPGWTHDDLEVIMREVTADSGGVADAAPAGYAADAPVAPQETPAPATDATPSTAPVEPRADRRRQQRLRQRLPWKAVTTVVLLGVLVAAVALVLLQSAGVIDWGFLGPTA
jgi:hypothetical protein